MTYTQADRPLAIETPLGDDVLHLARLTGYEATSQLFNLQLDLLAETNREIAFDRIVGQSVTVKMQTPDGKPRYFNGLVKRFTQRARDETFVHFHAEIVPQLWLLTKKFQSRIFQHIPVPEMLRQLFSGLQVTYEIFGTYYPRDYCVQYRESDFNFASRIMEEEGIYYFFKHAHGSHVMVVTDSANHGPTVPGQSSIVYEEMSGDVRKEARITAWEKSQELRSGEYTLWDHCFEMPGSDLEAQGKPVASVSVGKVIHKLGLAGNDHLEIYDYPGGYAQRFDGVDRHGAPQPENLKHIFEDRQRTVRIRMEEEQATSLEIAGASDCGQFAAGHKFTLDGHYDGDGPYLLTRVEHDARQSGYRSGEDPEFHYGNRFTCIPGALRYRPGRVTPRALIQGIQTATVVGPPGEEIFVDQYGRVKVQFHWDRQGKKDADSSCWLRVAQVWAGKGWGAFFWPRIGHEVVVAFEDGDPDRPLVVGSVYNGDNKPPLPLPVSKMFGGIKSSSVHGSAKENFNGITFVDVKGKEHLAIHSERHMAVIAEYDVAAQNGRHHFQRVPGAHMVTVGSMPGVGGSGGGPAEPPLDAVASLPGGGSGGSATIGSVGGTPWTVPQPTSAIGLSSSVVYGSAFQSSWPISLQLANNSLIQIVLDPAGFEKQFPTAGHAMSVASLGLAESVLGASGNMQLTLGNSATITMGRSYDVHIGPEAVTVHTNDQTGDTILSPTLGALLGMIAILFQEAYALLGGVASAQVNDDIRGILVWAFQTAVQVLLWNLLSSTVAYKIAELEVKIALNKMHVLEGLKYDAELLAAIDDLKSLQSSALGMGDLIEGLIVPTLLASISEGELSQADGLPS